MKKRVLAAISGGVDSAVAARLALESNHEVVGVTMRLWGGRKQSRSCSTADADEAANVAKSLQIEHIVLDHRDEFEKRVVEPYMNSNETTPNPCIECNGLFKIQKLSSWAVENGFDSIITGHYCSFDKTGLYRGVDPAKDQSYFMYKLITQTEVEYIFPLGKMTKAEVRQRALEFGLLNSEKQDSMGLCFAPTKIGKILPMYDPNGNMVGSVHGGQITIGQRRGLGISSKEALYVDKIEKTRVVLGTKERLQRTSVVANNWVGGTSGENLFVQFSAHGRPLEITTVFETEAGILLETKNSFKAVAAGQHAVLYDKERVVGGGEIVRTF